jgi:HEAT repeat protein
MQGPNLLAVKKRLQRAAVGVLIGFPILVGAVWLLSKSLGNSQGTLYAGQTWNYWTEQLDSRDAATSNKAYAVVNAQVVPQLVDTLFHDTNDSKIRLGAIDFLNGLPGIQITYLDALERRAGAAGGLGRLGPAAQAAVPYLIQELQRPDGLHESAIRALGNIHSDPEVVIPLLITYLTNDDLSDKAAIALGKYGGLAKAAVPKVIPLLKARDKDIRWAAHVALKQIDPEAAAKAGVK